MSSTESQTELRMESDLTFGEYRNHITYMQNDNTDRRGHNYLVDLHSTDSLGPFTINGNSNRSTQPICGIPHTD